MVGREPRTVAAGHGLKWAREGLELVAASPVVWIGITMLFLLMAVVISIIPLAGMLWGLVVPIHVGGLMLGCRALRQGQPLEVRYLFNGFEAPRLKPLAMVGLLYLAGSLIVMVPLFALAVIGALGSAFVLGAAGTSTTALAGAILVGVVIGLVVVAGIMLLHLALWFAPALVVFDGVAAMDALKASLRAGWMNVGAFTVYSVVLLGVAVIVAAPLVAAILLTAVRGEQAGAVAVVAIGGSAIFTLLCTFLLMPSTWASMYASYEDVFGEPTHLPQA